MTAFAECFFFLRAPDGGVEDLARMKAAGFGGVFCNVRDHPASRWESSIRPRAHAAGMFCGPWARTTDAYGNYDVRVLDRIIGTADHWASPLIVNIEADVKGSGSEITSQVAAAVGDRDGAISMEPIPFANVDWRPVGHLPVLPQCFGPEYADAGAIADLWHRAGVRCVYPTFGSYSQWRPSLYPLQAPYSIYTADDCGYDYKAWSPTSTGWEGCVKDALIPPTNGDDMEQIGKQHGITGFANWLRTQPGVPPRGEKYDPADVNTWPWPDKIERTLNILAADHDESTPFDA